MTVRGALSGLLVASLLLPLLARPFYLPGVAPVEFKQGDDIPLFVNKLTSVKTQIPFHYYDLPFCKPDEVGSVPHNMGQVLGGSSINTSPYELKFGEPKTCQVLCKKHYDAEMAEHFSTMIDNDYHVHWILDNLPSAVTEYDEVHPNEARHSRGFRLGFEQHSSHYINNHIKITIQHNEEPDQFEGARIVGFLVEPHSVNHKYKGDWSNTNPPSLTTCSKQAPIHNNPNSASWQAIDAETDVIFSYDVRWEKSEVNWSNRWDVFLAGSPDDQIHWFSIINSLMIVFFLTGMIAMIMLRTLHKDISKYNEINSEDMQEETGWKLVHGDVFRAPTNNPNLFCVFVGTGVQVTMMTVVTMTFALLGFLSPANRGGLLTAFLLLYVFMGSFAGYHSARLYKVFKGKDWKQNTIWTACAFPVFVFVVFFMLNAVEQSAHKSTQGGVAIGTLIGLVVLWFGISVPLVFLGSYYGFQKEPIEYPIRTNQIARQIPEQPWYMHPVLCILVGGILPFGAVFIELFFIMSAIWLHQIYYLFGFLVIVLAILFATCAEVTIVMCYFQLCSEDYEWWWRSFLTSGSAGIYLFLYSILYFHTKLEITAFNSILLYFGYMFIISVSFFFLTGTFGFFACFWFTKKIYSSIKVD
jgi:transmembrane 9 superfamily protein 2/4